MNNTIAAAAAAAEKQAIAMHEEGTALENNERCDYYRLAYIF